MSCLIFGLPGLSLCAFSQLPDPVLIGYFHNWNDVSAPSIPLDQVDSRFNVVDVAFAVPRTGTDYYMEFIPDQESPSVFAAQVQTLKAQGRKVLISIGGAATAVSLDNTAERDSFVVSMLGILNTYNFDGIDIDLEGSSLTTSGGTISLPVDTPVINLIEAIRQIMSSFYLAQGKRMILTMAPETAYVQGGQSTYGGIWGAYLPLIDALRDSLDVLHVQLYNSGSMYGIDGNIYTQGTADFIVAMCEAVIQGFNTTGGTFAGLSEHKIAVGLPACSLAAGGGFADTATVHSALDYLRGIGPRPGMYTLHNPGGYPELRGMMTWSINWDAAGTCGNVYEYADNFMTIFGNTAGSSSDFTEIRSFTIYPTPVSEILFLDFSEDGNHPGQVSLYNLPGEKIFQKPVNSSRVALNLSDLPGGFYLLMDDWGRKRIVIKQ